MTDNDKKAMDEALTFWRCLNYIRHDLGNAEQCRMRARHYFMVGRYSEAQKEAETADILEGWAPWES